MILFEPDRRRKAAPTLVDQTAAALEDAISARVLRPGMALPSIREFARNHGLSTFTVMAAYNRLVARGLLQSRPGANFRVSQRKQASPAPVPEWVAPRIGASWLLADVFADQSISIKAGCRRTGTTRPACRRPCASSAGSRSARWRPTATRSATAPCANISSTAFWSTDSTSDLTRSC